MEKYDIAEGNMVLSLKLHGVFQYVGEELNVDEYNQQRCGHT